MSILSGIDIDFLVNSLSDAFIVIDDKGIIQSANKSAERMFGYTPDEMQGNNITLLMQSQEARVHDAYISRYTSIGKSKIIGTESGRQLIAQHKNGSLIPIDITLTELIQNDQQYFIGVIRDVSERYKTEQLLTKSQDRLRRSQIFANIGTWDWNIVTGELFWSERIAPLFGYEAGELETSYDNFLAAVHPDDRQAVIDAVNNCVEHNAEYNIEHRVVWPDGKVKWVLEKGDVVRDENGKALHMLGVVSDIDKRKQLELLTLNQKELLDMLQVSLANFMVNPEYRSTASYMLDSLIRLTNSEYGFIGEILHDENDQPYLKTHAISNIAWNETTQKLYEEQAESGLEFYNLNTLFGAVISSGDTVISNSPATDSRAGGIPQGHPDLNTFLGIPIYYGNDMVGMYGIANRPEGYDEDLADFLKPFDISYSTIIKAKRSIEKETLHQQELVHATEEAISANKAKSEFLSSMSHELRTPLNAILGFAQLLEIEPDLSNGQKENITEIIKAGRHLLELINEVLDLAKIEAGHMQLSIDKIDVSDLLQSCESMISSMAEQHNIEVVFPDENVDNTFIHADYTKTKQVLTNLLSNAIKYNKPGGKVVINCDYCKNNEFRFSVIDTGKGIPNTLISQLFIPFKRLIDESVSIEGTGIGLTISKQLVELMGGRIGVESIETEGSTFWFCLPLYLHDTHHSTGKLEITRATQSNKIKTKENKKAVYIEDNPANLRLITQIIAKRTDVHLYTADEPISGIELIKQHQPDFILLDINLPVMSGYEILDTIKKAQLCPGSPVLAITANAMPADVKKIQDAGFDGYFTKPVNIDDFLEKINAIIESD